MRPFAASRFPTGQNSCIEAVMTKRQGETSPLPAIHQQPVNERIAL
jgi:hypothetical protein